MPRRQKPPLSVIVGDFASGRPPPPSELTKRQAAIWRSIVETEATELFATAATRALLADYCRARETAETYTALVQSFDSKWLKTADGLERFRAICRGRDVEVRAAVTLAMKLRMTNQARQRADGAATAARHAAKGARPWES